MAMLFPRRKKAFTLVELIIVIVVLSMLSAIATLSYIDISRVFKEELALSNLRVIKSAVHIYRYDHSGEFPSKLLSTSGNVDGLDYYLEEDLKKVLRDPNHKYKYRLSLSTDSVVLTVIGPNSFRQEIIITK